MKYSIKLEKSEEGYAVWCPALPGCVSQGMTEEEAISNMKDAIRVYRETELELSKHQITREIELAV
jgi:predicted RNase H-like HicB family nuclease